MEGKQGSPLPRQIHCSSQCSKNTVGFFVAMKLSRNLSLLAGPPVNVSCNIFINSFGSIAETTMVSEPKHKLLFPAGDLSRSEILTLRMDVGNLVFYSGLHWYTMRLGYFYCVFW